MQNIKKRGVSLTRTVSVATEARAAQAKAEGEERRNSITRERRVEVKKQEQRAYVRGER
jgi:hypothetical protein